MYNSWELMRRCDVTNCINESSIKDGELNYIPLMKKLILSSWFHSENLRGCTLVVNLKPLFSFMRTFPAGTEAFKGEMILHIPRESKEDILVQSTKPNQKDKKKKKKKIPNFEASGAILVRKSKGSWNSCLEGEKTGQSGIRSIHSKFEHSNLSTFRFFRNESAAFEWWCCLVPKESPPLLVNILQGSICSVVDFVLPILLLP